MLRGCDAKNLSFSPSVEDLSKDLILGTIAPKKSNWQHRRRQKMDVIRRATGKNKWDERVSNTTLSCFRLSHNCVGTVHFSRVIFGMDGFGKRRSIPVLRTELPGINECIL